MANKYHRQGFKTGLLVKGGETLKKAGEAFKNIYKEDKTGKKDRLIDQLNKNLKKQKLRRPGFSGSDIVESSARMRKGKPGKSFIEIDARVKRENLRDYYKNLPPLPKAPPKGKK